MKKFRIFMLICFICGFLLAVYELVTIQLDYSEGDQLYENITLQAVSTNPPEEDVPAEDIPEEDGSRNQEISLPQPGITVDFDSLNRINPDIFAWLHIPNSSISYPLLQTDNNDTYLHQASDHTSSIFGSIFMDFRNSKDLSDRHSIIYGHNMKNGSMFGSLKKYKDRNFYLRNPYFFIITPEVTYTYEVFSFHETAANGSVYDFFTDNDKGYQSFLEDAKASSLTDTGTEVAIQNRTVTLSTCTSSSSLRFVVHGKLVAMQ